LAIVATSALEANALDFANIGKLVSNFNRGMMQSMQPDPENTYSDCYKSATTTGASIEAALDFSKYMKGEFNSGQLMEQGQLVMMNLMSQYNSCNFNGFLVQFD